MKIEVFKALKDAIRKLPDARSYRSDQIGIQLVVSNNDSMQLHGLLFIKSYEVQDREVYMPPAHISIGLTVPGQHIVKSNIVDYYWLLSEKSKKYLKSLK